jgi:NAD(P)-dependent dehydrogenase (short-subunit alcohol dehydrogenase family)
MLLPAPFWHLDRTSGYHHVAKSVLVYVANNLVGVLPMLLKDKIILVSGIGPGLGVKLAVEAAREGARGVAITARTAARLAEAEKQVHAVAPACKVLKVPTDIQDAAQCARAAIATVEAFGRIDGLANSGYIHGGFEQMEKSNLEEWAGIFATNVRGSTQMTLACVPHMKRQGGGAVVMINSMGMIKPYPGGGLYAATKGALLTATKYLAVELGPDNIRVNTARMGWMWGEPVKQAIPVMAQARQCTEQQIIDGITANIPLRRIVTDDECARTALFLLSDYASGVTGAVIDCNGGEAIAS